MKLLILLAIFDVIFAVEYKDEIARYKMYPAAAGAYEDTNSCIKNNYKNGEVKRRIVVECDPLLIDTCSGFSAYSADENIIILSFRGTTIGTQLIMESEETIFAKHTNWTAGGKVSKYFNDGFIKIWNKGMKDDFATLSNKYPTAQLYITGHSLGGALAALCGSYIAHYNLFPREKTLLYTFGEPRVGDKGFAEAVDKEVPNAFRITHYKDIVPHLPMQYIEKYHHHETEVFYEEDMTPNAKYTVCSHEDESLRCSNKEVVEDSGKDHVTYFSVDIGQYAKHGCQFTGLNTTSSESWIRAKRWSLF